MNEVPLSMMPDRKASIRELLRINPRNAFHLSDVYEYFGADDPESAKERSTIRRSLALLAREPDSGVRKVARGIYQATAPVSPAPPPPKQP